MACRIGVPQRRCGEQQQRRRAQNGVRCPYSHVRASRHRRRRHLGRRLRVRGGARVPGAHQLRGPAPVGPPAPPPRHPLPPPPRPPPPPPPPRPPPPAPPPAAPPPPR